MAIATLKPTAKVSPKPEPVTGEPKNYKSVIYDDRHNVPVSSLLAYVSGAPWTVDYYSQILARDSELKSVDPALPSIYSPYTKIHGLELRVSSFLSSDFDAQNNLTNVRGTATVYPFLVPNKGDCFVTGVGLRQVGLFQVTEVARRTFNRDSVYEIEYELKGYIDQVEDQVAALEKAAQRHYHFSRDRLIEGLAPILKTDDYHAVNLLNELYRDIVSYYLKTFYSTLTYSINVPGQEHRVYDPHLVNFLFKIVDPDEAVEANYVYLHAREQDKYQEQPQFWDVLINKSYKSIDQVNSKMGLTPRSSYDLNPWLRSLRYNNFDYVVSPISPDTSLQVQGGPKIHYASPISILKEASSNTNIQDTSLPDIAATPLIHPVLKDDYYVLSEAFYNDGTDLSILEILTRDYASRSTISTEWLIELSKTYYKWGRLEQFYYGPILITLLKDQSKRIYS